MGHDPLADGHPHLRQTSDHACHPGIGQQQQASRAEQHAQTHAQQLRTLQGPQQLMQPAYGLIQLAGQGTDEQRQDGQADQQRGLHTGTLSQQQQIQHRQRHQSRDQRKATPQQHGTGDDSAQSLAVLPNRSTARQHPLGYAAVGQHGQRAQGRVGNGVVSVLVFRQQPDDQHAGNKGQQLQEPLHHRSREQLFELFDAFGVAQSDHVALDSGLRNMTPTCISSFCCQATGKCWLSRSKACTQERGSTASSAAVLR